jgi:hypothetical protein
MEPWAGNFQEEGPWSYYHPTLDQTIVVEAVDPVIHWVYDVVAEVVGSMHPEVTIGVDHILDQVHMVGVSLAESGARDRLAAVAAAAGCRPKRPSILEAVGEIHQDSGQAQRISYHSTWKESR